MTYCSTLSVSWTNGLLSTAGSTPWRLTVSPIGVIVSKLGAFSQRFAISANGGLTFANDTGSFTYGSANEGDSDATATVIGLGGVGGQVGRFLSSSSSTLINTGMTGPINSMAYDGTKFVCYSGYNGSAEDHRIGTSPTGVAATWTLTALPVGMSTAKTAAALGNGRYLLLTMTPFKEVWYSTDVDYTTYSQGTIPATVGVSFWEDVVYGAGTWVACARMSSGATLATMYSTDEGLTWTAGTATITHSSGGPSYARLTFGGGVFMLSAGLNLYFSNDGITWCGPYALPDSPPVDIAYDTTNSRFVTVSGTSSPNNKVYLVSPATVTTPDPPGPPIPTASPNRAILNRSARLRRFRGDDDEVVILLTAMMPHANRSTE